MFLLRLFYLHTLYYIYYKKHFLNSFKKLEAENHGKGLVMARIFYYFVF